MGTSQINTDRVKNIHKYKTITSKMMKLAVSLVLLVAIANATPLVQNQQLVQAEKEIRAQLTTFFEGENVADAKQKAKDVSDKIVQIYEDSTLTIQEKATQVRSEIENVVGKLNKANVDKIMANVTAVYAPYLEKLQENENVQKAFNWMNGLL